MEQPSIPPSMGQPPPGAASLHPDHMVDGREDLSLDQLLSVPETAKDFGSDTFGGRLEASSIFPKSVVEGVRLRSHHEARQRGLGIGRFQRTGTRRGIRKLLTFAEWADVEQASIVDVIIEEEKCDFGHDADDEDGPNEARRVDR